MEVYAILKLNVVTVHVIPAACHGKHVFPLLVTIFVNLWFKAYTVCSFEPSIIFITTINKFFLQYQNCLQDELLTLQILIVWNMYHGG